MAEDYARSSQYAYIQNSNLVLEADRESRRRPDEATGEVETLAGRISYRMGDRAQRASAPETKRKKREETEESAVKRKLQKLSRAGDAIADGGDYQENIAIDTKSLLYTTGGIARTKANILSESAAFESSTYKPKNASSQAAYDQMLSIVTTELGAQPREILAGTAEEIVSILKNDNYRDGEKLVEVQMLLKFITPETFNQLVILGRQITDFFPENNENEKSVDPEDREDMDKELGVAVVFDDEEESDLEEIHDEQDEEMASGSDVDSNNEDSDENGRSQNNMRLKDSTDTDKNHQHTGKYDLNPQDIDAYWLQRQLSKYYSDAERSASLSEDVLKILTDTNLSSCENHLVLLLDYDKFDFIKLLLANRVKVLYCTRLKQAQNEEERKAVENELRELDAQLDGQGSQLLYDLSVKNSADSWMQDRIGAMETTSRAEAQKLRLERQKRNQKTSTDEEYKGAEGENDVVVVSLAQQEDQAAIDEEERTPLKPQTYIDFETLAFAEQGHLMSNKACHLPEGTWRAQKKGYEEVHVPAVRAKVDERSEPLKLISSLPSWTHPAFRKMESLNRVQSKMYSAAFESSENLLLCAPTGAGKTNVAMLTILHEVMKARDPETGEVDLGSFKIVYVAPMKALVQEVVLNLEARLTSAYKIQVRELSGDQNLSREELYSTQIIVTTPEKWDIITRKAGDDRTYTQLVKLIIFDEIHLLHDSRGPVLEAIVSRTLRTVESTQSMIRLVGLSATLPNYEDVAAFLRVDPAKGLFFFDSSYRPVPLQQQYIGIMEKKAIKRFALMNAICYEKVVEQAAIGNQVLIFVHSRKETVSTAQSLRDLFLENDTLSTLLETNSASSEILREESEKIVGNDALKELLPFGFGTHHAGMQRVHRTLVEKAFAAGHLKVLISTSTLAWGVNLPAHTVIIKGTQVYKPERGDWEELSPLDVLQMLGRAGRIQYDTQGEGIIITQHAQLTYYLSLMNQQLPVESQMLSQFADHLNAEIVSGSVQSISQAATWLGYTYLFIRMIRNPVLYGLTKLNVEKDRTLLQTRLDFAHSAATLLAKHQLIKYERRSGRFQSTPLGRVASHYYIRHSSIATYNTYLKPQMSDIEVLRLFSLSEEFKFVMLRSEEKLEMMKLVERVPVPVKEALVETGSGGSSSGSAKVNVLLQAYISRLKLEGFALVADMTHIHQSAGRIFRALFEISLHRSWASLAERLLIFCKMVDHRVWLSHSPLRQLTSSKVSDTLIKRLEKKDLSWENYVDLDPADLGQLVNQPKSGKVLYQAIHQFPRLEISAHVQPITRSMVKVDVSILPDFDFNKDAHGNSQGFWIFVEDVDGETMLHYEYFLLKRRMATEESYVNLIVPLFEPLAPLYFLKVVSDKWLHCEFTLPLSFQKLILPAKTPPPTELLDLQPLHIQATLLKLFKKTIAQKIYSQFNKAHSSPWQFKHLNPIQTQILPRILESDSNIFVGAPPGSGKLVLAEIAILKILAQESNDNPLIVYIHPKISQCNARFDEWSEKFGPDSVFELNVLQCTGDQTTDVRYLSQANILITTPIQWDVLSRRWKQRKRIQMVNLVILDAAHFVGGGEFGPTMEIIMSRMRFIRTQIENVDDSIAPILRLLALSNCIANAQDVGEWLGASATEGTIFNFHPTVRPIPLEIRVQGFEINDFSSRLLAMAKPVYNTITSVGKNAKVLIFVPSGKQAQLSAIDLITFALAENDPLKFRNKKSLGKMDELSGLDSTLNQTLEAGVGYISDDMLQKTQKYIMSEFESNSISILVAPQTMAWSLSTHQAASSLVVIMGAMFYDGKEHRYVDYQLADVLQMTKFAKNINQQLPTCALFCHASKKKFFAKFLYDPLPLESQLEHFLSDHMNAEIVAKTIESKQEAVDYLTWTLMYRRLRKNPNYYNLQGASNVHLSDHLSDVVERTVTALEESRCLQIVTDEDDEEGEEKLVALNLGMIAAYYCIQYTTIELYACSITASSKVKALLAILASSSEYSELPVRYGEEDFLKSVAKHLKFPIVPSSQGYVDYSQAHVKANILLQLHFGKQHLRLNAALLSDLNTIILPHAVRLLQAMVDVISSNGWLQPALAAMDLTQMVVQAQWSGLSPLLQIPYFTKDHLTQLKKLNLEEDVETPLDILSMEDTDRQSLLAFEESNEKEKQLKMSAIAKFCNAFPDVNINTQLKNNGKNISAGSNVFVQVQLSQETEDDDEENEEENEEMNLVNAIHYPMKKTQNWWIVIGDSKDNRLLSIKRAPFGNKKEILARLEFTAPDTIGNYQLQLYVICDSYIGCDLENELKLQIIEANGESTSESEEEDSE